MKPDHHKTAPEKARQESEYSQHMTEQAKKQSIKPGSPEMETLLSAGYPDIGTRKHALELLKERKENPLMVPYEVAERAKAFLAALDATPQVIHPPDEE